MDLDLARRFLLAHVPKEAQTAVQTVFEAIVKDPVSVLNNSVVFSAGQLFKHSNQEVRLAAVSGMHMGVALCYAMRSPKVVQDLGAYVESVSRERGENVVNLLQRKKL